MPNTLQDLDVKPGIGLIPNRFEQMVHSVDGFELVDPTADRGVFCDTAFRDGWTEFAFDNACRSGYCDLETVSSLREAFGSGGNDPRRALCRMLMRWYTSGYPSLAAKPLLE
ncbi:hypothetical protein ACQR36_21960 [Rhodococcus erythropolis]|uniref:hypothetical protein n=1 Tax=Rhodococcus erythropolis TaxID=1833 RepID=UPI003D0F2EDD